MKYLAGTAVMAACLATAQAADERNPLVDTAFEFLARASSTSEVLTLNLTNLLILLVLKAIIFGFGLFSFGGGNSNSYSRSADSSQPMVKQTDLTGGMCFMMYLGGDMEKMSCIERTACEDPKTAADYLTAAKMWYKIHKLVKFVPFQENYVDIMNRVTDASSHSINGGDCAIYKW